MPLLNERIDVWAPVQAEHVEGALYRVLGPQPDHQEWQFSPDTIVRVAQRTFSGGGTGLAAIGEESD